MMLGAFFVIASFVIYFEFIQSAYGDAQGVKAQLLSEQSFLNSEKETIGKVRQLIASYQSQGQVQQAVSAALPTTQDLAGALAQLTGLAQQSALAPQSYSVVVEGLQNLAQTASANGALAPVSLEKPLGTATFQVKLTGGYENLKNFISLLETNIRIFDLRSLSVQPGTVTGPQGKPLPDMYSFDMSIKTYFQIQ